MSTWVATTWVLLWLTSQYLEYVNAARRASADERYKSNRRSCAFTLHGRCTGLGVNEDGGGVCYIVMFRIWPA